MANLGQRRANGAADNSNPLGAGNWTVTFDQSVLGIQIPFEVYHIAISGPSGSAMQVYLDTEFYSYTSRGDINEWDPSQPMHVRPGQTIYFYWNSSITPIPVVSLFCREPSLL